MITVGCFCCVEPSAGKDIPFFGQQNIGFSKSAAGILIYFSSFSPLHSHCNCKKVPAFSGIQRLPYDLQFEDIRRRDP